MPRTRGAARARRPGSIDSSDRVAASISASRPRSRRRASSSFSPEVFIGARRGSRVRAHVCVCPCSSTRRDLAEPHRLGIPAAREGPKSSILAALPSEPVPFRAGPLWRGRRDSNPEASRLTPGGTEGEDSAVRVSSVLEVGPGQFSPTRCLRSRNRGSDRRESNMGSTLRPVSHGSCSSIAFSSRGTSSRRRRGAISWMQ